MVSNANWTKVCTLCGEDCSSRKRAKDAEGRYYCLKCFDRRLNEVQRRRALEDKLLRTGLDPSDSMSSTFGVDVELIASEAATVDTVEESPEALCPYCGLGIKADSVLCVHCGQDFAAGKQIKVRKKIVSRERPAIWPTALGFLCVAFSAAGLYVYGSKFVRVLLLAFAEDGPSPEFISFMLPSCILLLLLSIAHGLGGGLVWMRIPAGVTWLRSWWKAKLILISVFVAIGLVGAMAFPAFTSTLIFLHEVGAWVDRPMPDTLVDALVTLWVWQCAWPIALLLFFRVEKIQKDVQGWYLTPEPTIGLFSSRASP